MVSDRLREAVRTASVMNCEQVVVVASELAELIDSWDSMAAQLAARPSTTQPLADDA